MRVYLVKILVYCSRHAVWQVEFTSKYLHKTHFCNICWQSSFLNHEYVKMTWYSPVINFSVMLTTERPVSATGTSSRSDTSAPSASPYSVSSVRFVPHVKLSSKFQHRWNRGNERKQPITDHLPHDPTRLLCGQSEGSHPWLFPSISGRFSQFWLSLKKILPKTYISLLEKLACSNWEICYTFRPCMDLSFLFTIPLPASHRINPKLL